MFLFLSGWLIFFGNSVHWYHISCTKFSVVLDSILSQRPALPSLLDSQAYTNMEIKRKHIDFNFDLRDTMLTLQIGFRFVRAAVACQILERTSSFWAFICDNCSKVFEACYNTQLLSFYLNLSLRQSCYFSVMTQQCQLPHAIGCNSSSKAGGGGRGWL